MDSNSYDKENVEKSLKTETLNYSDLTMKDLKTYAEALEIKYNEQKISRIDLIQLINQYYSNEKSTIYRTKLPSLSVIVEKIKTYMNEFEYELKMINMIEEKWIGCKKNIIELLSKSKKLKTWISEINAEIKEYEEFVDERVEINYISLKNNINNIFQQNYVSNNNIHVKKIKVIEENKSIEDKKYEIEINNDPKLNYPKEFEEMLKKSKEVKILHSNHIWNVSAIQKFFYLDNKLSISIVIILENITMMILNAYNDYVIKLSFTSIDEIQFKIGNDEYGKNRSCVEKDVLKFVTKNYRLEPIINNLGMEIEITCVISDEIKLYIAYILTKLVEFETCEDLFDNFDKVKLMLKDDIVDSEKLNYITQKLYMYNKKIIF
jgi:hypothetical protein